MAGHLTDKFSYRSGALRDNEVGCFLCGHDNAPPDAPHTAVFVWNNGQWGGHQLTWTAHSIAVTRTPKVQFIALGASGQVLVMGQGETLEEDVLARNANSEKAGSFREVRAIGGTVYAVGMDRQVYRREGVGHWIDFGRELPPGGSEIVGLESIHGLTANELIAVGWNGEIWRSVEGQWTQIASPTNLLLHKVLCVEDGKAFACGQSGVLLQGNGDEWQVIQQDESFEDFWDMQWFKGRLYISTSQFLYHLDQSGKLQLVEFDEEIPDTCYHLSATKDILWSIGAKDVMAFDGSVWSRLD